MRRTGAGEEDVAGGGVARGAPGGGGTGRPERRPGRRLERTWSTGLTGVGARGGGGMRRWSLMRMVGEREQ